MAIWRIPLRSAHFLLRLSDQQAGHVTHRQSIGSDEWIVEFRPTSSVRHKNPDLPRVLSARLLRYQRLGFKPSWLLTSLTDAKAHPYDELVDLYHRRWQIETIYREWKHGLNIQNLRSHTPAGVLKEIYAHLILNNLVRWVMVDAVWDTELNAVDLSYLTALTHVRAALVAMGRSHPQHIRSLYQCLLANIRSATIRKRPGRSYPRRFDKPRNRGYGKMHQPARVGQT